MFNFFDDSFQDYDSFLEPYLKKNNHNHNHDTTTFTSEANWFCWNVGCPHCPYRKGTLCTYIKETKKEDNLSKIEDIVENKEPEFKTMGQRVRFYDVRELYDKNLTEMEEELKEINNRIYNLKDELSELEIKSDILDREIRIKEILDDLIEFEKQGFTLETLLTNKW